MAHLYNMRGFWLSSSWLLRLFVSRRSEKFLIDGIIMTVAGNGGEYYPGDGSLAVNAGILVQGVALDAAGNLFVSGGFEGVFQVWGDGTIKRVAGNGQFSSSGDGVPASSASVGAFGLRIDPTGRIYFADGVSPMGILQPVNEAVLIGAIVDGASESAIPISPGNDRGGLRSWVGTRSTGKQSAPERRISRSTGRDHGIV
jgi:hypothetical protein